MPVAKYMNEDKITKKHMSYKKGEKNVMKDPKIRHRVSESLKKTHEIKNFGFQKGNKTKSQFTKKDWKNPSFARTHLTFNSPNNQEISLSKILQEACPNIYAFVGNGQFVLNGKCPDFVSTERKKIIELFGEYWHTDADVIKRILFFNRLGYTVLIVWAKELKNKDKLKFKIKQFTHSQQTIPIILSSKVFLQLKYYTAFTKSEFSSMGTSEMLSPSVYRINELLLLSQECSAVNSIIDESALVKLMYERVANNEKLSNVNVWVHSHGEMEVYWSTTDEKTIENSINNNYLFSLVTNKKRHILGRLDIFKPFRTTIDLSIIEEKNQENQNELKEKCQEEISTKVRKSLLPSILKGKQRYSIHRSSKKV